MHINPTLAQFWHTDSIRHVWIGADIIEGGISVFDRTPLHAFWGQVTTQTYMQEFSIPIVVSHMIIDYFLHTLQHDNDRPHTARHTMDCKHNIAVVQWPSLSPDLAPIEHVWNEMGRRLANMAPSLTLQQLEVFLYRIWQQIPPDFIRSVIFSFRSRCVAVMYADGDSDAIFLVYLCERLI